ncbi:MAG: endopeptidase La [Bacteroidales bacterium]
MDNININNKAAILLLRDAICLPDTMFPINIGRESTLNMLREASLKNLSVVATTQKDASIQKPKEGDFYTIGTLIKIVNINTTKEGSTALIKGERRVKLTNLVQSTPYFIYDIELYKYEQIDDDTEFDNNINEIRDLLHAIVPNNKVVDIATPGIINIAVGALKISTDEKQRLFELPTLEECAQKVKSLLEEQVLQKGLQKEIEGKVKNQIDDEQRKFLLHKQLKSIQEELGENSGTEINILIEKSKEKKWGADIKKHFDKEISKIKRMNSSAPEYSVQINYLQTFIDLPWNHVTTDVLNMQLAEEELDKRHYGLQKVKERILEYLAVLKLKNDLKSPILCLYGPPGVGKTSLGRSIANAIGRKYVRMSLGGVDDESEIRGHRKTYIGAMPGRIIQNIKKARSSNPVFVLDEIDKLTRHSHGDPSSALLEVLDPEQNFEFHDNYLEINYDLSKVIFIATANNISDIPIPLRDRMEIIEVPGYTTYEKTMIAKEHIWKQVLSDHGITDEISISDDTLVYVIESYTMESGVRALKNQLAKVARKIATLIAYDKEVKSVVSVEDITKFLGIPIFSKEEVIKNNLPGIVRGLAWTPYGGEVLFIESVKSPGKGNLKITGNVGDVMKESALIAFEIVKSKCELLCIDPSIIGKHDIFIHVPQGAIPKDGPSAGIAMVTSIASSFTGKTMKQGFAMTGEVSLTGNVLPVGGIKEKVLAAKRVGVVNIIIPERNKKDIDELDIQYIEGLNFKFVSDIKEVLNLVLL